MVLPFVNETGFVSNIIVDLTNNITGSLFLSLLLLFMLIVFVALLFRFPLEIVIVLVLPVLLVFMASTSDFLAFGGVILMIAGVILAKNFFLR